MRTLEQLGISPAPWKATGEYWVEYGDYAEDDMRGAFETFAIPDTEEAPANARLIAAAPDLYHAAYMLVKAFDNRTMIPEDVEFLRSALAKAGGAK